MESGRKEGEEPASKHQIQPAGCRERAGLTLDGTPEAVSTGSQAQTGTAFPVQLKKSDWQP